MLVKKSISILLATFALLTAPAFSQENAPTTRILFIFDGSGSMHGGWETGKKIDVAQRLMTQMLDSIQSSHIPNLQLALRVYGHTKPSPPQDCNDTRLEVPFSDRSNIPMIKRVLSTIIPKGTTPIARSMELAAEDFTPCEDCRNIIILITDGIEECNGDPCAVSLALQERNIALKPFVIGIGLDEDFSSTFGCMGSFYDAADEGTFKEVLRLVISQALNNTTAQINLNDDAGNPSETNVPLAIYDHVSGKLMNSFVHTMNFRGNPDTIVLDPLMTYDIEVFTVPSVRLNNVQIRAGEHNVIDIDAGRGALSIETGNSRNSDVPMAIVRRSGWIGTINAQPLNTTQAYLTGTYDAEVLTLPRINLNDIEINQSETTDIAIPPPGYLNLQYSIEGYGGIYVVDRDNLEWVIDINMNESRESFNLQPGKYRVIYRAESAQTNAYSKSKVFTITSGSTTIVKIQ